MIGTFIVLILFNIDVLHHLQNVINGQTRENVRYAEFNFLAYCINIIDYKILEYVGSDIHVSLGSPINSQYSTSDS